MGQCLDTLPQPGAIVRLTTHSRAVGRVINVADHRDNVATVVFPFGRNGRVLVRRIHLSRLEAVAR